ncbi:MAG: hypothetical protein GYA87_02825 [Christensenellaceae bacterium]|nr:hypothetical protein [Christensenellaceae bacterium]
MKSDLRILSFGGSLGDQIIIEIVPHRENLRHNVVYAIKNSLHHEDLAMGKTSHMFTIPLRWANSIRDSVKGMLTIVLSSYDNDSGEYIGSSEITLPINVPIDVKPFIDAVEITPINSGSAEGYMHFIQGISKLRAKISARGNMGSTVSNISVIVDGITYKGQEIISQYLLSSGESIITVKVTDSRGRVESLSQSINIINYAMPSIKELLIKRCDDDGTDNNAGQYIKITAHYSMSHIVGCGDISLKLSYKEYGASEYLSLGDYTPDTIYGSFDPNKSYYIKFLLDDGINATEHEAIVSSSNLSLNISKTGNGVGIGCLAQRENAVEIAPNWELYMKGKSFLDCIYPLGAIYISRNGTSPQSLFGGTWQAIEARFLLASNGNYPAGSTGGSFSHALKINEMPRHRHVGNSLYEGSSSSYGQHTGQFVSKVWKTAYGVQDISSYTGDGDAHNITPPYYSVYMWERIA